ncbi:MAG: gliding motility-associated C-terminal domain-containing protein [Cytophagaceae bacterium]
MLSWTVTPNNLNCNGDNSGSINVAVTGAFPSYTYSLFGVVTGPVIVSNHPFNNYTFTNLPADNNYFVVVQVPLGGGLFAFCTQTVTVSEPPPIVITLNNQTNNFCFGQTNGSLDIDVSGGAPALPYSYTWSNGATTQDISNLANGTYSVTVRDGNNCPATASYDIISPSAITLSGSTSSPTCAGTGNGSIDLSVSGGTSPYTYAWSNGATTEDISGLNAGSFSVTVTDATGCTGTQSFNITNPPSINLTHTEVSPTCNGGTNGSINLSVAGGTAPYIYSWSNGSSTQDLSGISAGTYSVTVTDANSCSNNTSITLTEPTAITATSVITNVTCNGGTNGAVNITAGGGAGSYTFTWSNGATSEDISGIAAGNYSVTIRDANGCTNNFNFTVNEPSAITTSASTTPINCSGGTTGGIDLTVGGGTSPYTYLWSNGNTTQDLSNIGAGTYTVTVTDANSCTATFSQTLTTPSAISAFAVVTDVACLGGNNGSIDLTVSGGTAPYTYLWSNAATTEDVSGLVAGNYNVVITDAAGCIFNVASTIGQPTLALTSSGIVTQVTCFNGNDGNIDITVSGGTAPYIYSWDNGATTQDISGLVAGSYNLTITDAKGCVNLLSFTINQPSALSLTAIVTDITCNGLSNGTINLTVSGGTSPFMYNWSNGANTEDLTGLAAGNYTITVTDGNSCITNQSYTIIQPAAINVTGTITNTTCTGGNNGAITTTVSGGTSPYTYSWSNGATTANISGLAIGSYTVTVTDNKGCVQTRTFNITAPSPVSITHTSVNEKCFNSNDGSINITVTGGTTPYNYSWSNGATTEDISGLDAGSYLITVTDNSGCIQTRNITITSPTAIVVSNTTTPITCFGANNGSINVTVSGGTAPYTYLWSNGATTEDIGSLVAGTYNLTITDSKGCTATTSATITQPAAINITRVITNVTCNGGNDGMINITVNGGSVPYTFSWSTGATSEDIASLTAGSYTITVTDANGCSSNANYTVIEPSPLIFTTSITDADCSGGTNGSISITAVNGGTAPYTYLWSNGATTASVSNLTIGSYSVTVTDNKGCSNSATYSINTPTSMIVSGVSTPLICNGASTAAINISISGGTTPYIYSWSNGANTEDLSSLPAGTYTVTVTDANLCATSRTFTIANPTPISVATTATNVLCNGGGNGAINLTVSGGNSPYTFAWNTGATIEDISGLAAGNYTVTVTDATSCTANASITITEPTAIVLSGVASNSNCNSEDNGSIDLNVSGGSAPYSYLWSNGMTSQDISGLAPGSYSVTVSDNNTCNQSANFTITEPAPFQATATVINASCGGGSDGSISITSVTGGTSPYNYVWSTGSVGTIVNNLTVGSYTVSITDNNGCTNDSTFLISTPSTMVITSVISNISCNGGATGAIDISVSGGASPYTYVWSTGATTEDISGLTTGNYSVIVTDAALCSQSGSFTVNTAAPINATLTPTNVLCNGGNTGSIDLTVSGGSLPYSFSWNTGATTEDINNLLAGSYSVTITDNGGCTLIRATTITEPALLQVTIATTDATCNGATNGTATPNVNGGTSPYSYAWSNGNTAAAQTTLASGAYSLTVTDARGCTASDFALINNGPAITGTASGAPAIICSGSSATITAALDAAYTPGTSSYSFDNGLNFQSGTTYVIPSLLADSTVKVVVRDINGCMSLPIDVALTTKKIDATVNVTTPPTCASANDAVIDVVVNGSSTGFTYAIDGGTFQSSPTFTNVSGGTHSVEINDGSGCNASFSVDVVAPNPLTIAIKSKTDITGCFGNTNGAIQVTVNGGSPTYTFQLSGAPSTSTDSNFTALKAGPYIITVSDINGCTASIGTLLTQPSGVDTASIVKNITNVVCPGRDEGTITLSNVTGGTAPYTYTLGAVSNTTSNFTNLTAGNYTITITDANGCNIGYPFTITEPNPIVFTAVVTRPATCQDPDGIVEFISVTGGNPGYVYSLDDGNNYFASTIFNNLVAADYEARVKDSKGCTASYTVVLPQKEGPIPFVRVNPPTCNGYSDGYIVIDSLVGGVGPFSYKLNNINFGSSTVYFNISKGDYALQISDIECSYPIDSFYLYNHATGLYDTLTTDSIPVTEPEPITASTYSSLADRYYATAETGLYNVQGGTPYYSWSRDNLSFTRITTDTTILTNFARGVHTIYLQDSLGCKGQVEVKVNVAFFIPNLISPNNDGQNDRFEIMGLPRGSFLRITNRWGDTVYRSENYDNSWDADELSDAVYYYILQMPNGDEHKGWVQVVR